MFEKKYLKIKITAGFILAIALGTASYVYVPKIFQKKQTVYTYQFSQPDNRPDIIKGKTVTLKRLRPSYFKDYFKMFNYPGTVKPLFYKDKVNFPEIKRYLDNNLKREAANKTFLYMIFDNKDNKLIGSIEIRKYNPKDNGQFGIWISPKYWGKGKAEEAFKLISNEYFKIKKADKFIAHVEMWNLRSYYALKKYGFKLINTLHYDNRPSRYLLEYYNPNKK